MKKRAWKVLFLILLIISGYTWYYYNNIFARISGVVTLVSKSDDSIKVRFENGEEKGINTPEVLMPFLEEGQQYFVSIYQNKLREPFIVKIEP